jgi:hypothetical protein
MLPTVACIEKQAPMILNTQQYPTSSSGYTAQLQRNAQRCATAALLQRLNGPVGNGAVCPPLTPIKIQTNSGAHTVEIQKCHNYAPTIINNCSGVIINGISAGGTNSSQYTRSLVDNVNVEAPFNPDTRFDAYKPYIYPVVPSTIIFTSPTVPVPAVDACLLPSVNVSGPNPISSQPTNVTTTANSPSAGYVTVTWTPGNDRSIVKFNIYVNGTLTITNQTGTSAVIGPFSGGSSGNVYVEPVAANNWRGAGSLSVSWSI